MTIQGVFSKKVLFCMSNGHYFAFFNLDLCNNSIIYAKKGMMTLFKSKNHPRFCCCYIDLKSFTFTQIFFCKLFAN